MTIFEAIETVIQHPRYFVFDSPKKLVEIYSQKKLQTFLSSSKHLHGICQRHSQGSAQRQS